MQAMNVRRSSFAVVIAASLCAATVSCTPKPEATPAKAADDGVSYTLGTKAMVQTLYPDASWLPVPPVAKRPAFSDADCAKYLPPS